MVEVAFLETTENYKYRGLELEKKLIWFFRLYAQGLDIVFYFAADST